MRKTIIITTLLALIALGDVRFTHSIDSGYLGLLAAETQTKRKTRKTPALRERIYSQLARAQKLADEGKVAEGLEVLNKMSSRLEQMNAYERAMLWNFKGFIYYTNEDIPSAVKAFKKVVNEENIPESLELSTLFSLSQLLMSLENYDETLSYLERWDSLADVNAKRLQNNALKANAYYAKKDYANALLAINAVLVESNNSNMLPKENWLVLKRALHYELKETSMVAEVTEQLVKLYSKPNYWVELANIYGELGQEDLHLAVMETAYQQGYVEKSRDLQTLAQLYYYSGAPFKAAKLLSDAISTNRIQPNLKILTFEAQSWEAAHEVDNAIEVLKRAIPLSKDGEIIERLARLYVDRENWHQALHYANQGLETMPSLNKGNLYVAKGIALFNLKRFDQAASAFEQARKDKSTMKLAAQWLRYIEKESQQNELLMSSLSD